MVHDIRAAESFLRSTRSVWSAFLLTLVACGSEGSLNGASRGPDGKCWMSDVSYPYGQENSDIDCPCRDSVEGLPAGSVRAVACREDQTMEVLPLKDEIVRREGGGREYSTVALVVCRCERIPRVLPPLPVFDLERQ